MKSNYQKGFTLVDTLVYVAILVIVSTAGVYFMISLSEVLTQYRIDTALYRSGTSAMEQILVGIRQAESLDSVTSVVDDPTAGIFAATRGASSTEVAFVGNELQLTLDGQPYGPMTDPQISVAHFTVFQHPTADGELIRVRLHLEASINGVNKGMTFYGGAIIRGDV